MFFMFLGTACFLFQGQRGGWNIHAFLELFFFCGLPLLFGFHNDDTEKSRETIATPPKRGVPTGPDSGTVEHASIRPPGGRYRRYLSLREGSETGQIGASQNVLFSLSPNNPGSVLAVKGPLRALVH